MCLHLKFHLLFLIHLFLLLPFWGWVMPLFTHQDWYIFQAPQYISWYPHMFHLGYHVSCIGYFHLGSCVICLGNVHCLLPRRWDAWAHSLIHPYFFVMMVIEGKPFVPYLLIHNCLYFDNYVLWHWFIVNFSWWSCVIFLGWEAYTPSGSSLSVPCRDPTGYVHSLYYLAMSVHGPRHMTQTLPGNVSSSPETSP